MRPHALITTFIGWICVRICAPDALHLVWDRCVGRRSERRAWRRTMLTRFACASGTMEIIFGIIFPLTCVHARARARPRARVARACGARTVARCLQPACRAASRHMCSR